MNDSAVEAIKYALEKCDDDSDSMMFLRYWNEGEFEVLRRNWENIPDEVFIDADPLFKSPAHIEDGEEISVVRVPSCENSYGFGYVDGSCHVDLRKYRNHLEDILDALPNDEPLMTVAQHERIVATLSASPAAGVPHGLEELLSDLLRCGMDCVVVNGESMRDRVAAMLKTVSRSGELAVPTIDIQHCVFIGKNADGSSPVDVKMEQQGPLKIGSLQSVKMHGWQCIGPLLSDEDKAWIAPVPPASEQQRAVVMPGNECQECKGGGEVYDVSGEGPWSCYACSSNQELVGYANFNELDNMLDDRTATISPVKNGWYRVPLYRATPPQENDR